MICRTLPPPVHVPRKGDPATAHGLAQHANVEELGAWAHRHGLDARAALRLIVSGEVARDEATRKRAKVIYEGLPAVGGGP